MGAVQAMNAFKRWVYNPPGMNLYLLASSYLEVSNCSNSERRARDLRPKILWRMKNVLSSFLIGVFGSILSFRVYLTVELLTCISWDYWSYHVLKFRNHFKTYVSIWMFILTNSLLIDSSFINFLQKDNGIDFFNWEERGFAMACIKNFAPLHSAV